MIYHLTEPAVWERSLADGSHTSSTRGRTLEQEGFIHCSTPEQWPGVRDRFYADVEELLLLHVDERLVEAPVVFERVGDAPGEFPHVYGPIPLTAVVRVERL